MGSGAGAGKVLLSDSSGNASWHNTVPVYANYNPGNNPGAGPCEPAFSMTSYNNSTCNALLGYVIAP